MLAYCFVSLLVMRKRHIFETLPLSFQKYFLLLTKKKKVLCMSHLLEIILESYKALALLSRCPKTGTNFPQYEMENGRKRTIRPYKRKGYKKNWEKQAR